MLNKAKIDLLNFGLKFVSVDDKLVRLFLETVPKDLHEIVILPVSKTTMKEFVTRMGKSHQQHGLVHNGLINGVPVSTIRCQMGAPYAAIVMECLKRAGVKKVIRCDYAGSLSDRVNLGDLIVPEQAIGAEGTTPNYITPSEPAGKPSTFNGSQAITTDLLTSAKELGCTCHKVKIVSTDALFRETTDKIAAWQTAGADAVDMETSALYCLGDLFSILTGAILAISDKPGSEYDLFHSNKIHENLVSSLKSAIDVVAKALPKIKNL
ncbi:MAG: purine nucleoside phosphorylase [Promethearchaeota archaeon CR_4]|nr:MAG: purine nucleoside phosphorylase [Candidatus Lokiarchaeota archaeon CR_4]